jgi:hypothetical protein
MASGAKRMVTCGKSRSSYVPPAHARQSLPHSLISRHLTSYVNPVEGRSHPEKTGRAKCMEPQQVLTPIQPEPFVDPTRGAAFLSIRPRQLLELARANVVPGYPIGRGKRRVWRFRLSELAASVTRKVDSRTAAPDSQKARRKR